MALAIGIDMGGTKIQGILMDEKGRILKSYRRPTEAHKPRRKIVANIVEVINKLKTRGVKGVGVGVTGFAVKGKIVFGGGTVPTFKGAKIKKEIEKKTGLKAYIENDANCFALAEHRLGAARGSKNCLGVIIGTGVGLGIIINNRIYSGSAGGAGEAGQGYLATDRGIKRVEELIGGKYITGRYEELSGRRALSARVVLRKKDPAARQVYREVVLYTGLFFANLINTFNPEYIVVGGGVSNLPFYRDVQRVVNKYAVPYMARMCRIKKHAISDDSGTIGAAQLVFEK